MHTRSCLSKLAWTSLHSQASFSASASKHHVPKPFLACLGFVCRYDDPRAHELELRDVPLMSAWRQAILGNTALFRGATVLDVGCGLGALSLLCAKVGLYSCLEINHWLLHSDNPCSHELSGTSCWILLKCGGLVAQLVSTSVRKQVHPREIFSLQGISACTGKVTAAF